MSIPSARHLHACALIIMPLTASADLPDEYKEQTRAVATRLAILDGWQDIDGNLAEVRRRYRDWPPLCEAQRFHLDREQARLMMGLAGQYRYQIVKKSHVWPGLKADFEYLEWEALQLYVLWDAYDDLAGPMVSPYIKRRALWTIKRLLGDKDYAAGAVLSPFPLWRFEETLP